MDVAKVIAWQEKNPKYASFFTLKRISQILYGLPGVIIGLSIFVIFWVLVNAYIAIMQNVHYVVSVTGTGLALIIAPIFIITILLCGTLAYSVSRVVALHLDITEKFSVPGLKLFTTVMHPYAVLAFFVIALVNLYGLVYGGSRLFTSYNVLSVIMTFGIAIGYTMFGRKYLWEDS